MIDGCEKTYWSIDDYQGVPGLEDELQDLGVCAEFYSKKDAIVFFYRWVNQITEG